MVLPAVPDLPDALEDRFGALALPDVLPLFLGVVGLGPGDRKTLKHHSVRAFQRTPCGCSHAVLLLL